MLRDIYINIRQLSKPKWQGENQPLEDIKTNGETMKGRMTRLLIRPGVCLGLVAASVTAHAEIYTVTNTADSGPGSLRAALVAANATAADDTINFDATAFAGLQTITITSGGLNVANNGALTIIGTGADRLRIAGYQQTGIFFINAGATATINDLTVTASDATNFGSAINNNLGTLTLNNVVVSGYTSGFSAEGGGIFNEGILTVNNSIISGNSAVSGGGISNTGTLTLNGSTVSGNSSIYGGGGIANFRTVTLNNSTVSDNRTEAAGGGFLNYETVIVNNATISGNTADVGGGFLNFKIVTLNNATVSNNTADEFGGIFSPEATINAGNSIIAGNNASVYPDFAGTLNSLGYNLIGNTSDVTITGNETGNLYNVNPLLGPLQDNGGPTQTQALLPGSPAIDAGNATLPTDQRGFQRPADDPAVSNAANGSDIGAVEVCGALDTDGDGTGDLCDTDDDGDGDADATDCAPLNPAISHNATEVCNGVDDNCNGQIDEGVTTIFYADADGDGYGNATVSTQACTVPSGYVSNSTDCDDTKASVYPGAVEVCGNGIDDNCNGQKDESCTTITVTIVPSFTVEGDNGKRPMLFIVALNKPAATTITVKYKTYDGSAKASSDYQKGEGTISFNKGQWLKFITINVYGDRKEESNEQFGVQLHSAVNVKINGTGKATGTILNDDHRQNNTITSAPELQVNEVPEAATLVVPNYLRRSEVWRIPNLPANNQVVVSDINGRIVLQARGYQNRHSFASLAPGTYFYRIITTVANGKSNVYSGKLLIVD